MKITFIQRQIFALPGIASLAGAVQRSGHRADVLIENAEKSFEDVLAGTNPDSVGVTICSSDVNWLTETLPRIRRAAPEAFLLVGGIHPTIHPALLDEFPEIDAICVGEGEEAVVELLDALSASSNGNRLSVIGNRSGGQGNRLSVISDQLPITDHRSPITDHRSPITDHRSPITDHRSPITDHRSPITDHRSPITDHRSPITDHRSPITDHRSPITDHRSPITDHRSPITDHRPPTTDHRPPITSIKNLHIRWDGKVYRNHLRPLITNLDDYPEYREIYFRRYPQLAQDSLLQYISSRGCPYACSFCVNETLNRIFRGLGPVHRRKSTAFAIRELKHLRSLYPNAATGFFIDDLFLYDREWVREFLPIFHQEIGLPFICSAGPKTIDEEMADLLKNTGCASVEFGIETGNEAKRKEIFNKKAFTDAEFRRQIGLIKSRGIEIYAPSMFVFPTETPPDSFRTVEFYHELKVDHPFSSFLMPFPDTRIYEIALEYGTIPPGLKAADLPGNYFLDSTCEIPRRRVIENIQYLFYFFVKFPAFYRHCRWLAYLPIRLKLVRYAGLFFWFKNWKRMGYGEAVSYFWRYRKAR